MTFIGKKGPQVDFHREKGPNEASDYFLLKNKRPLVVLQSKIRPQEVCHRKK